MKPAVRPFAAAAGLLLAPSVPAQLVISEFLANPAALPDGVGEYFELYNASPVPVPVGDLTLADRDVDQVVLTGATGVIPPGGFFVFGNGSPADDPAAVHVDLDYSGFGSFILANDRDEIIVRDTRTGTTLARLDYDDGDPFGPGVAAVLSRVTDAAAGLTVAADYRAETPDRDTLLTADIGSPGVAGSTLLPAPSAALLLTAAALPAVVRRRRG